MKKGTLAIASVPSIKWSRSGSNRRPLPCHGSALPTELRPQMPDERANACWHKVRARGEGIRDTSGRQTDAELDPKVGLKTAFYQGGDTNRSRSAEQAVDRSGKDILALEPDELVHDFAILQKDHGGNRLNGILQGDFTVAINV